MNMKIGLVLSGGGLKGNAHIGVLRALDEMGIKVDVMTGASIGSIITALYLSGITTDKMSNISESFNKDNFDLNFSGFFKMVKNFIMGKPNPLDEFQGIVKGDKLEKWMDNLFGGKKLTDFQFPFAFVATDIDTGKEVILSNNNLTINDTDCITDAKLSEAVRASIAIPVVFTPKHIAGHDLLDGGIIDNLPVDAARALGADKVIAVNLQSTAVDKQGDNLFEIAGKALQMLVNRSQFYENYEADVYINPDLSQYTAADFGDSAIMIEIGYQATMAVKKDILNLLK